MHCLKPTARSSSNGLKPPWPSSSNSRILRFKQSPGNTSSAFRCAASVTTVNSRQSAVFLATAAVRSHDDSSAGTSRGMSIQTCTSEWLCWCDYTGRVRIAILPSELTPCPPANIWIWRSAARANSAMGTYAVVAVVGYGQMCSFAVDSESQLNHCHIWVSAVVCHGHIWPLRSTARANSALARHGVLAVVGRAPPSAPRTTPPKHHTTHSITTAYRPLALQTLSANFAAQAGGTGITFSSSCFSGCPCTYLGR